MIIHSLKTSGFRIIGDPIEIHFPEEGRIAILGQNESGKTTILQAIEYALYGLKKGAGVEGERENLVTWGKNEAKLEITFTSGQDTYVLQRTFGVKSGHKASLIPVIVGARNRQHSITNLSDIEARIEQITGMDRDSFTKLVYIKQKDLDALKELAKSKREQLINKVMGIEVFDDASAHVKDDKSALEDEFDKKYNELDSVHKNKEQYETTLKEKTDLENLVADLQQTLKEKGRLLDDAKSLLEKYEWLYAFKSTSEVISSLREQVNEIENSIKKISGLEENIEVYTKALAKYKTEVEELQSLRERFLDVERRFEDAKDLAKSTETKRRVLIEGSKLTDKDVELLSQDLPAQKRNRLIQFIIALISGLGLSVIGSVMVIVFLIVAGLFILGAAGYIFYNYWEIDKLLTANADVNALTKQLKEQDEAVYKLKAELGAIVSQNFRSHEDVDKRLSAISEKLKEETREDAIPIIEAVLRNADNALKALKESKPIERKHELENQIQEKENEILSLERIKPASIEEFQYNKEEHEASKRKFEENQKEYNDLDKTVQGMLGTIQQMDRELNTLKSDYDHYPELEQDVKACSSELELLKRVLSELFETSKELRNKVIPHARFIINQVLPTLTDGRYSDFEITEDLKFKVHSNEAGGYKEREIFSGGTQDQFLIALRLAFTQSILDSRVMADRYALLMDECISSSDDIRKQGIFEVLDAMKRTFSQIFIIAHEDISDFVDYHITLARNERGYTEIKSRSW